MTDGPSSARPGALVDYGRSADELAWDLRSMLRDFDRAIERVLAWSADASAVARHPDMLWPLAATIDELGSWVATVGWAFAVAGAGGDASTKRTVHASTAALDAAVQGAGWTPATNVRGASPGEWLRAFDPRCRSYANGGYVGAGFLVGPDGRSYPLVAPHVVRDGVEYHADNGVRPGERSVLDLDGDDPGWTTLYERIGVERFIDEPGVFERLMTGVGASVVGRPNGSTVDDVEQLVIVPGAAPTFRSADEPRREDTEEEPPPYLESRTPTGTGSGMGAVTAGAVPMAIDVLGGAVMADQGSHAGYDVVFQQNADGRVRALYKRVYVGFGADGRPYTQSAWVYGPETNDRVLINYAS